MAKIRKINDEFRIIRSGLSSEGFKAINELETFLQSSTQGFKEKVEEVIKKYLDLTDHDRDFLSSLSQELSNIVFTGIQKAICRTEGEISENDLVIHYINRLSVVFENMYKENGKCIYSCNMYCDEEVKEPLKSNMVIELSSVIADSNNQELLRCYFSQEIENYKNPKTPKEVCMLNLLEELLSLDYSKKIFINDVGPVIENAFRKSFDDTDVVNIFGSKR